MKPSFELLVVFSSWGLDKTVPRFSETECFGRGDKFHPHFSSEWRVGGFYRELSHLEFDLEEWGEAHGQV